MAVPEQTPYQEYTANGVATSFAVAFQCLSKDTLIVTINGVEQSSTLWSFTGGNIVFVSAPLNNSIVSIKRSTHLKREVSYNSFTNSMLPTVFNGDFDRIWHTLQEQSYKLGQYDFDYSYAVNTSNQANQKSDQANQKADLALEGLETVSTETQPILRGGTGATTAEDARNNLDVYSQAEVDTLIATGGSGNIVGIENGGTGADTAEDARNNLDVYSQTEVDTAIANATPTIPDATETVAGKAKIATTAIAQAGVNDTDIITALKLHQKINKVSFGINQVLSNPTTLADTWYTNTSGKVMFAHKMQGGMNQSVVIKVRVNSIAYSFSSGSVGNNLNSSVSVTAIIPIGAEYQCNHTNMIIFS